MNCNTKWHIQNIRSCQICHLSLHGSDIAPNSFIDGVRYVLTCIQQTISESFPAKFCMLLIDESMKLRLIPSHVLRGSYNLRMFVSQFYSKIIPLVSTMFHNRTSECLQSVFLLKIYKTTLSISNRSLRKLHYLQTVSLLLIELSADDSSFSWESFCWISAVSLAISGC